MPKLTLGSAAPLCLSPRGDVVDGEEDHAPRLVLPGHRARVQQHGLGPDAAPVVLYLELLKPDVFLEHLRERLPQRRDVPLAVSQFVDEVLGGLLGRDLEGLIERAAGPRDAQANEDRQNAHDPPERDLCGSGKLAREH